METKLNNLYEEQMTNVTGGGTEVPEKHWSATCPKCHKTITFFGTKEDWKQFFDTHVQIVCQG